MATSLPTPHILLLIITTLFLLFNVPSQAQLSPTFYDATCPDVVSIVRASIQQAVTSERRMAASLIRLHFHDCFSRGCDASLLLDGTTTIETEKNAAPNGGFGGGVFEVIETAKSEVERVCPGVVSCADILSLAARDASEEVGGPSWTVRLGRRDSNTTSVSQANVIPLGDTPLGSLISIFEGKGFTAREMVALSGAHTIGQARCLTFRARIYDNRSNIDPIFAATRRAECPLTGGDENLAPLDLVTPTNFDNNYFSNLIARRGLLASDQALFNGGSTDNIVSEYSTNSGSFTSDFADAMVKMSEMEPLTGSNGIIRQVCNAIN